MNRLESHISPKLEEIKRARDGGASKRKIAQMLGISIATLNRAQKQDKEVASALQAVSPEQLERNKIKEAFLKRACGYIAKEEVREIRENKLPDGSVERELVLTKQVSKEVPPDLAAAKWLMENAVKEKNEADCEEDNLERALEALKLRERLLQEGE